ncbi:hypothetical protein A5764_09415 [Mycobacterium sp. 852002-51057_SCH5723018]|nr:hypothetical protein A5764_09415 [Mycobacterium sp. 852002-51057_SCH5723018]
MHRQYPDSSLPLDGCPYPDEWRHRRRSAMQSNDRRRRGADIAALLDTHFAQSSAAPGDLADVLHGPDMPYRHNSHIAAAALRADRERALEVGRWLVRHGTDRCAVGVGLALLAEDWAPEDIPLIQTIGLLSRHFGALAAHALRRRRGGEAALLWLGARVTNWGRVHVVEGLCQSPSWGARSWLLRHSCDGPSLAGYYAGKVAAAAHLHEAITHTVVDDELVDHTCLLMNIMATCAGMGITLSDYPPGPCVLAALADHRSQQRPTAARYIDTAVLTDRLASMTLEELGLNGDQRGELVRRFLAVLNRDDWCTIVRDNIDLSDPWQAQFERLVAPRMPLRAFANTASAT